MTAKEIFLQEKEAVEKWQAIAHTDWFKKVLLFTRQEAIEQAAATSPREISSVMKGIRLCSDIIETIADPMGQQRIAPKSLLHHDLETRPPAKPASGEKPTTEPDKPKA